MVGAFAQSWLVSPGISPALSFALVLGFSLFHLRRFLSCRLKGQGFLLFSPHRYIDHILSSSPPMSASPIENWGSIFCYQNLMIKYAIYITPRLGSRGSPIPMARDRGNPRFFKYICWINEYSTINSTNFVDLWVSTNFDISNKKLTLFFVTNFRI